MMLSFKNWLEETKYLHPDLFYNPYQQRPGLGVTFIYTQEGNIYYAKSGETHGDIIDRNPELAQKYELTRASGPFEDGDGDRPTAPEETNLSNLSGARKDVVNLRKTDLNGRINKNRKIVSFWNKDKDLYDRLLVPCIQQLIKDGMVSADGFISTPLHKTIPISQINQSQIDDITPEMQRKLDLYSQLHLMRPEQKKAAMRELGLSQGAKKPSMQDAAEKAGMVSPGNKWWASTSEQST